MSYNYMKVSVPEGVVLGTQGIDVDEALGIIEYTVHPFAKGLLTTDGNQYSTEVLSTATDAFTPVESITIDNGCAGLIRELEFGLCGAVKNTSSTTSDISYLWQGRNSGGTWVNLMSTGTVSNASAAYLSTGELTFSGVFATAANLSTMPIDVRFLIQGNEASEAYGKVKNSSYIKVTYVAD